MRTVFRNSEIPGRIHALQPFLSVGKLPDGTRVWSGHSGPAVSLGHLPARLHESARSAVYVVYSYATPIAWVVENPDPHETEPYEYTVPDVGYSPTTGQHQYAVLEAWREVRRRQGCNRWAMDGRHEFVRVPGNAVVHGTERRLRSGGMDGARPGETQPEWLYDDSGVRPERRRRSAYEGTGDDASHWTPQDPVWLARLYPNAGYRHPSHP